MSSNQEVRKGGNVTGPAFVLILLGIIFLLRNFGILDFGGRWWAFFLLIPIFFMGNRFLELRKSSGSGVPAEARGMLTGFFSVALTMVIFLFDLDWGEVWPLFIIIVGASLLVGRAGTGGEKARDPAGDTRQTPVP